ncbi:MAG: M48 family metalloprotease [Stellaceae bacterium]
MLLHRHPLWLAAILFATLVICHQASAQERLLRDTEIETDIKTMAAPIWHAAGLDPGDVRIYMIDDREINSFVAGGQAIFLNTGLLERVQNANQLIGVIAHETGHIAGGHILRTKEALRNASIEAIIATVLGAAAGVAGHNGVAILGGMGVGERSFLRFSIAQEATADHAAMNYLDRTCQSARGLLDFFEILQADQRLSGDTDDPWVRTHPLTSERIDYVRDHVQNARCSNAPSPPGDDALLRRIQMKLHAFLDDPSITLSRYPESDKSENARYARAIALYRIPQLDKALQAVDRLIHDYPENPYFRELKGQMLFENGHAREAVVPYHEAVRLDPSAALLRIALAQVYIETHDPALNKRAIGELNAALQTESRDNTVWQFLAIAYGRDHQIGMAALCMAEEALADGKKKAAAQQALRARQLLPHNTVSYARAVQIGTEAERTDDD